MCTQNAAPVNVNTITQTKTNELKRFTSIYAFNSSLFFGSVWFGSDSELLNESMDEAKQRN